MRRTIESVYRYHDYRVLLLDDFTIRSTENTRYSLRSYARDLRLSPGYVSDILRGKKHLNLDNYGDVFARIGINQAEELEYLRNLIQLKTAASALSQQEAIQYFRDHYESLGMKDHSERDLLLKSSKHLLIYSIISRISESKRVHEAARSFGISDGVMSAVLIELKENGYISEQGDDLFVTTKDISISASERILACGADLAKHLFSLIAEKGGIEFPQRSTQTLVMGFDEETFAQALDVYKHFLHQIYRISKNTKSIDRIAVYSDLLYSVQTPQDVQMSPLKTVENSLESGPEL